MATYTPVNPVAYMSKYGYWIVSWSVAPGKTMSVMLCRVGITREEAISDSMVSLKSVTGKETMP